MKKSMGYRGIPRDTVTGLVPGNTVTRLVEEAVAIRKNKDTLNRDTGTLPTGYDNLF